MIPFNRHPEEPIIFEWNGKGGAHPFTKGGSASTADLVVVTVDGSSDDGYAVGESGLQLSGLDATGSGSTVTVAANRYHRVPFKFTTRTFRGVWHFRKSTANADLDNIACYMYWYDGTNRKGATIKFASELDVTKRWQYLNSSSVFANLSQTGDLATNHWHTVEYVCDFDTPVYKSVNIDGEESAGIEGTAIESSASAVDPPYLYTAFSLGLDADNATHAIELGYHRVTEVPV